MTDKYIDLKDRAREDSPIHTHVGIVTALLWLDEHPDLVPGRTITAVEVGRHAHLIRSIPIAGQVEAPSIIDFLEAIGITVVPDLEPTNAEKIEEIIGKVGSFPGWERRLLAEQLDKAGVKAPGGDDG